jgi:prepilin-type N-terminal cleavage/methylation domain-containing protein
MKKGFTLVEMAIVLLVIGALAGIVLRNIGGQTATARDSRRVGDLRNTANYLSAYMARFGQYPTTTDWNGLETILRNANIVDRLPRDPSGPPRNYDYYYCTDSGSVTAADAIVNHFILRAQLEQPTSTAPRLWELSVTSTPWSCARGTTIVTVSNECNQSQRYFCFAQ